MLNGLFRQYLIAHPRETTIVKKVKREKTKKKRVGKLSPHVPGKFTVSKFKYLKIELEDSYL